MLITENSLKHTKDDCLLSELGADVIDLPFSKPLATFSWWFLSSIFVVKRIFQKKKKNNFLITELQPQLPFSPFIRTSQFQLPTPDLQTHYSLDCNWSFFGKLFFQTLSCFSWTFQQKHIKRPSNCRDFIYCSTVIVRASTWWFIQFPGYFLD